MKNSLQTAGFLSALLLSACGGGGGGDRGGGSTAPGPVPPPPAGVAKATLDIGNTGQFGAVLYSVLGITRDDVQALRIRYDQQPAGSGSGACEHGGSASSSISKNPLHVETRYDHCGSGTEQIFLDGTLELLYASNPGDASFSAEIVYTNLTVSGPGFSETRNGRGHYEAGTYADDQSQDRMTWNLQIDHSAAGTLSLENVVLEFVNTTKFESQLVGVNGASGTVTYDKAGSIDLDFDESRQQITFSGAGDGLGAIEAIPSGLTTLFRPDANSQATAFLTIIQSELAEVNFFDDEYNVGPRVRLSGVEDISGHTFLRQNPAEFSLRPNFTDLDGDLLQLSVSLQSLFVTDSHHNTSEIPFESAATMYSLEEIEAGKFQLASSVNEESATFNFSVSATDAHGLTTTEPLIFSILIYRDTDLDGDADIWDDDDDNDGVVDYLDDLPLDPAESVDSDQDGIGNNSDPDDDNDGVADIDDFYPLDSNCYLESDGNGDRCTLSLIPSNADVLGTGTGILLLVTNQEDDFGRIVVHRLDTQTGHFLAPVYLAPETAGLDLLIDVTNFNASYSKEQNRIYADYAQTAVTYVDLDDEVPAETLLAERGTDTERLVLSRSVGPWFVLRSIMPGLTRLTSYDEAGITVDHFEYASSDTRTFTVPANATYCAAGITIDSDTGMFFEYENPGRSMCSFGNEPLPSPDGTLAVVPQRLVIVDSSFADIASLNAQNNSTLRMFWGDLGLVSYAWDLVEVFDENGALIGSMQAPADLVNPVVKGAYDGGDVVIAVWRDAYVPIRVTRWPE